MILIIMDEILKGICEHCMTLNFVYHRAMITVDRPIDSYLYRRSFLELIGSGFIGRLIERSDLRLFGIEEPNRPYGCLAVESPTVPVL